MFAKISTNLRFTALFRLKNKLPCSFLMDTIKNETESNPSLIFLFSRHQLLPSMMV